MDPHREERLLSVITHRHSERGPFDPSWRVTEHELAELIEAARWAPTADNLQSFRLVIVDDQALIERIAHSAGAPMVIVVAFDPRASDALSLISLGCVLENLWLAASACRLDVQIMSELACDGLDAETKRVIGVPGEWRIAYALRIGHALSAERCPRTRRDPAMFVSRNRFA